MRTSWRRSTTTVWSSRSRRSSPRRLARPRPARCGSRTARSRPTLLSTTLVDVPLNIIDNFEKTIVGANVRDAAQPAGDRPSVREPMVPLRMFEARDFAIGNATTFLMSGAIFAGGLLVTEEFQLARQFSPVSTGVRVLPFFATPMLISPVAGALSDRIGRRPIIVVGLSMLTGGFAWVAWRGSLSTNWIELVIALLVAGVGISMALPTVPTAVLSAVAPDQMGKASGINYMAQRFGAVFAIAICSTVFATNGGLSSPATVTAGFKPALWACAGFALLGTLSALTMSAPRKPAVDGESSALPIAA